ncbi:Hypothetical protein SRAE_1000293800 [Strongyloides ratti]|uniref:Uncharacterized protein n=1 Tax=Strongyloides ratti TaxID=34506 RepID=A0A090LB32_STRRB|nr:Hypothetical protein SRAE_1000293800 [Strongyloides ratti]CEF64685.1 Hypothetical protein SRAE_1000293800 [Strongyloides ratti]
MPPKKNNIKKNNKNIADDLSITLKDMQCKFGEEINNEEAKLIKETSEIINKCSETLYRTITKDMPKEFLDMKYKNFLEIQDSTSCTLPKPNDTMMIIQDIRNKVMNGNASPETVKKYQNIKKISQ